MTDNIGLPVSGYGPQGDDKIAIVNANKQLEERQLRILDALAKDESIDKRWLAIGRTGLERAWMDINRAVFKPSRIDLPEDVAPKSVAVLEDEIKADLITEMKSFVAAVAGAPKS